jgi:hypothetical protein
LALVVVVLRPALLLALRAVNAPQGHGTIGANMDDGVITTTIAADGVTWVGASSLTAIALWIAGPPLVLWLLWVATRRSPARARDADRDFRTS